MRAKWGGVHRAHGGGSSLCEGAPTRRRKKLEKLAAGPGRGKIVSIQRKKRTESQRFFKSSTNPCLGDGIPRARGSSIEKGAGGSKCAAVFFAGKGRGKRVFSRQQRTLCGIQATIASLLRGQKSRGKKVEKPVRVTIQKERDCPVCISKWGLMQDGIIDPTFAA